MSEKGVHIEGRLVAWTGASKQYRGASYSATTMLHFQSFWAIALGSNNAAPASKIITKSQSIKGHISLKFFCSPMIMSPLDPLLRVTGPMVIPPIPLSLSLEWMWPLPLSLCKMPLPLNRWENQGWSPRCEVNLLWSVICWKIWGYGYSPIWGHVTTTPVGAIRGRSCRLTVWWGDCITPHHNDMY